MYQINDEVTFLDEVGVFKIIEVLSTDIFMVEDKHGFDRKCSINEITLYKKNAFDGVEIETFENREVKVNPFAKSAFCTNAPCVSTQRSPFITVLFSTSTKVLSPMVNLCVALIIN